jgi:integrase
MARKVPPGLVKRGDIWHIQKRIGNGRRLYESTGERDLAEAEKYLIHRLEEIRNAQIYGMRPKRIFREAALKFLSETDKSSWRVDKRQIQLLDPFIGTLPLESIHMGTLRPFIDHRRKQGRKNRTVNYGLQVTRHILNLAASEWLDEHGMTWLAHAPKIKLLSESDKREPYPLTPVEQVRLFDELPEHLRVMALFKVNTGCREREVSRLRWDWEIDVPELETSVFVIPAHRVKNREDRLVVLNRVAKGIVDQMRGIHPEYVFTYRARPIEKIYGAAWRKARERAGLPGVRVHDLKHTFGRRLRAAGVSFEDRQDLLGHKSGRITTHYSRPELESLIAAANAVCTQHGCKMEALVVLRKKNRQAVAS